MIPLTAPNPDEMIRVSRSSVVKLFGIDVRQTMAQRCFPVYCVNDLSKIMAIHDYDAAQSFDWHQALHVEMAKAGLFEPLFVLETAPARQEQNSWYGLTLQQTYWLADRFFSNNIPLLFAWGGALLKLGCESMADALKFRVSLGMTPNVTDAVPLPDLLNKTVGAVLTAAYNAHWQYLAFASPELFKVNQFDYEAINHALDHLKQDQVVTTKSEPEPAAPLEQDKTFMWEDKPIRAHFRNGEALFCLADVCEACALTNPTMVAQAIKEEFELDALDAIPTLDSLNRTQKMLFITEPQLYFTMMRGRSKMAKAFRMWVNTEVLPAVRAQRLELLQRHSVPASSVAAPVTAQVPCVVEPNKAPVSAPLSERPLPKGQVVGKKCCLGEMFIIMTNNAFASVLPAVPALQTGNKNHLTQAQYSDLLRQALVDAVGRANTDAIFSSFNYLIEMKARETRAGLFTIINELQDKNNMLWDALEAVSAEVALELRVKTKSYRDEYRL